MRKSFNIRHEGGIIYQNLFTERFIVIAEKPSVARTIAQVLVCEDKKGGYLEGPDGVVSRCFSYLAENAMPEASDEGCRKWSLEALPIIPDKWKQEVTGDKAKQFIDFFAEQVMRDGISDIPDCYDNRVVWWLLTRQPTHTGGGQRLEVHRIIYSLMHTGFINSSSFLSFSHIPCSNHILSNIIFVAADAAIFLTVFTGVEGLIQSLMKAAESIADSGSGGAGSIHAASATLTQ